MKHIVKAQEPQEFSDWRQKKQYNSDFRDKYERFKKTTKIKNIVKEALMKEQGYICCYCERRLESDDSHIEHLLPREVAPEKSLDFDNLLCSCQKDLEKGEPRHCGNSKGKYLLPISPLEPDCATLFIFGHDGQILPAQEDNDKAQKTIEILQLNIPKLKALRRNAIEPFLDSEISVRELQTFITDYLCQKSEGKYG